MTTAPTIPNDRCVCHLDCAGCNYGPDNNAWCHNGRVPDSAFCRSCLPHNGQFTEAIDQMRKARHIDALKPLSDDWRPHGR